jgi:hypothetical protein
MSLKRRRFAEMILMAGPMLLSVFVICFRCRPPAGGRSRHASDERLLKQIEYAVSRAGRICFRIQQPFRLGWKGKQLPPVSKARETGRR